MNKEKECPIPEEQEVVTIEENGRPPVEVIHEGPTQPEERVQFNDELKEAELEAKEEEEDPDATKPEKSGFFAVKMRSFMNEALLEAQQALSEGEVPVGAVIVRDNEIIARAHNKKEQSQDVTAHAEILAIREASEKLGNWRLDDCQIYITAEPCTMCLGAILQSRIKKIVYGTTEPKFGSVESNRNFLDINLNKDVEIYPGILEEESREILKSFFKRKR